MNNCNTDNANTKYSETATVGLHCACRAACNAIISCKWRHLQEIIDLTNVETFYFLLGRSSSFCIIALSGGSARLISFVIDGRQTDFFLKQRRGNATSSASMFSGSRISAVLVSTLSDAPFRQKSKSWWRTRNRKQSKTKKKARRVLESIDSI